MKKLFQTIIATLLVASMTLSFFGCSSKPAASEFYSEYVQLYSLIIREKAKELTGIPDPSPDPDPVIELDVFEDGIYSSKEEVALYLHLYGHLPDNYITKTKAKKLGWVAEKGNLWEVTDHMSIGGGQFTNQEGILPKKKGRTYYECDIDYEGGPRNAKRIVWSNDGLIYYTDDHYNTFELLYGEE